MKINGSQIDHIVIRNKNGDDIIFIGEEETINNSDLEIWATPKHDKNFAQKLVTGKNSEVNK